MGEQIEDIDLETEINDNNNSGSSIDNGNENSSNDDNYSEEEEKVVKIFEREIFLFEGFCEEHKSEMKDLIKEAFDDEIALPKNIFIIGYEEQQSGQEKKPIIHNDYYKAVAYYIAFQLQKRDDRLSACAMKYTEITTGSVKTKFYNANSSIYNDFKQDYEDIIKKWSIGVSVITY